MSEKSVSVSQVVSCFICPVRFYIELNSGTGKEPAAYTAAKQISYHLSDDVSDEEIWDEIVTVSPPLYDDAECRELFLSSISACRKKRWEKAREFDVKLSSKKLGIHGIADRVFESSPRIAVLRSAPAPEQGIYSADRVRAALILFCAEETMGVTDDSVVLEYVQSGVSRICKVSPGDRRNALNALKKAKRILNGEIPSKSSAMPCDTCYLKDNCAVKERKTLADRLGI